MHGPRGLLTTVAAGFVLAAPGVAAQRATATARAPAAHARAAGTAAGVCDNRLVAGLNLGGPVSVVLVKKFRKGEQLPGSNSPNSLAVGVQEAPTTAVDDLCVVKLIVGPGVEGPRDEWSTTKGMGIEIWLPSKAHWQGRSFNIFPGGWNGSPSISSPTEFYGWGMRNANEEGFVSGATDGGNPPPPNAEFRAGRGMTFMLPDGSVNKIAWKNYVAGATHAMALAMKGVAARYYGTAPKYNYLTGCSSGGRAVYASAQMYPGDFDGILAECPSITQSHLHLSLIYAQILTQRELGGRPIAPAALDLVSRAAVKACDTTVTGQHDGYITDVTACRYDPTRDKSVLCRENGGNAPEGACLTSLQAAVVDKIWYGPTRDGSAPSPDFDNGQSQFLGPDHKWWGINRGARLAGGLGGGVANSENGEVRPFTLPMDQLALSTENSSLMPPYWKVGKFVGSDGWKSMNYADLADAIDRGRGMQAAFANIDSDNPDLREFAAMGHKLLTQTGGADPYIPVSSPISYFVNVSNLVGGIAEAQKFHRLFVVPGAGHCSGNGTAGDTTAPLVPRMRMLKALIAWVELGEAPSQILAETAQGDPTPRSRPVCMYPNRIHYIGGDVNKAESYSCIKS